MKSYGSALWVGGLLAMSAVILPLWSGAQGLKNDAPSAATIAATSVDRVDVARSGQQTQVRVESNGQLTYHVSHLADPPRLVYDFDGARLATANDAVSSDYAPVRDVRLGQREQQVRLVIDLASSARYSVINKDSLENGSHVLVVTFAEPSNSNQSAAASQPKPSVAAYLPVSKFSLPASLSNTQSALADPKQSASDNSAATSTPAQRNPGSVESASNGSMNSSPAAQAEQTASGIAPKYTGEPISVNLKDVDLKDFFRLVHEISGLNVVLDPSVHGTVTLVLDDVPWDQALDIVLKNNGLSKEIDNNVLRIASQDTVKKEAQDRVALAKAQSDAVDTVTVTRVLSYAKASDVVALLRRFLSPRGDIQAQDRANMLVIRDIPSTIPNIDTLIRQLDRKTQQVEIQARVVQASRTFARDIGTQFGFAVATNQGRNVIGGVPTASQASPISHAMTPPLVSTGTTSIPLVSNFPANAASSGVSFSYSGANLAIDYLITAAESKGVGKLLSSPQLVTQNNAQAIVKQGTQIPIQTTVNNTISTQYVDAVLELQVTPQITADGTVFMDVLVQNTQIDNGIPLVNGIPALDTESAQTKVLIGDGGTVVIGGVMVTQQQTNEFEVPLVGSIPLIGHLFKRNEINVQSQELLFFLTPRILPG